MSGAQQALPVQPPPPTGADDSPNPQPQGLPTQSARPAASASAPPQNVQPVAQSEPTPAQSGRPFVDPRPYAWLAENKPDLRAVVDNAADEAGVSPARIAAHMYFENHFRMADAPTSSAGAVGPMQVLPSTAKVIDPTGKLDVNNPVDNIRLGAQYIRMGDDRFGKDTPSSVAMYHGGPGSAIDIANHPDMADANHPKTMDYVRNVMGGSNVDPKGFTGDTHITPRGLVLAGSQGGPDGFLRYISQASPQGMPLTDAWQHAEGSLTRAFLERGDIAGAQHARDYVLQMSHAGSNQNLMAAYQSLNTGDSAGAAQYLAKAHAFFPDGSMGQFGVDASGKVWGQRMDEQNPTKPLGTPFQVTPNSVAGMLNQTADPKQFLATLLEQQKVTSATRHQDAMGDYYSGLLHSREQIAQGNQDTRVQTANIRADATTQAAEIRASRQGTGPAAALSKEADKETTNLYGSDADPTTPIATRATMSEIHHDVRMNGGSPVLAEQAARGLATNQLGVQRQSDGSFAVVDPKKPGAPIATLSSGLVQRLAGAKGVTPQAGPALGRPGGQTATPSTPVGAGAGTPYAAGSGVSQNLTGTVQPQAPQTSSAIPLTAGQ